MTNLIKQIFAFDSMAEYENHATAINILNEKLEQYKERLVKDFDLKILPKNIVWTSSQNAMTVFSNVPVPAYTNEETIFMSPSVEDWQAFYLSQLEGEGLTNNDCVTYIKEYFQTITIDHVFCVLAHELTHHIELFPDDFDDERNNSIWFEEGMCEYLSQKLTLTPAQFNEAKKIDNLMLELFMPKYGHASLEDFGVGSYTASSIASIMLNYWRSNAAIWHLVEDEYNGDLMQVFNRYNEWHEQGRKKPLVDYFGVQHF